MHHICLSLKKPPADRKVYSTHPQKKGVDFLLKDYDDRIIPIEAGLGRKGKSQIKKALKTYHSSYGIFISSEKRKVIQEEDVIFLPVHTLFTHVDK